MWRPQVSPGFLREILNVGINVGIHSQNLASVHSGIEFITFPGS